MSSQATAKISPPAESPELELVARAAAGDRDAFATLYNDHKPEVYRFLIQRTRNRTLAEDLTQETFLRALRRIGSFRHRSSTAGFLGWLCVIARNLHLDHLKLNRTRLEVPVAEVFDELLGAGGYDRSAEEFAIRDLDAVETRQALIAAMQGLTAYQREALRLRHFEGLSVLETAAKLGKHPRAVTTVTFRAMQKMQDALTRGVAA